MNQPQTGPLINQLIFKVIENIQSTVFKGDVFHL